MKACVFQYSVSTISLANINILFSLVLTFIDENLSCSLARHRCEWMIVIFIVYCHTVTMCGTFQDFMFILFSFLKLLLMMFFWSAIRSFAHYLDNLCGLSRLHTLHRMLYQALSSSMEHIYALCLFVCLPIFLITCQRPAEMPLGLFLLLIERRRFIGWRESWGLYRTFAQWTLNAYARIMN